MGEVRSRDRGSWRSGVGPRRTNGTFSPKGTEIAMTEIRAFIAIEIPEGVKFFLKEIVAELKGFGKEVSWTRPEAIHLTLKFLGNVSQEMIQPIEEALKPAFSIQKPFSLTVSGMGAFPSLGKPRVIWAGLSDEARIVVPMATEVEALIEPLGFVREKRAFNPHLTLGRVKSSRLNADLLDAIRQNMTVTGPSFEADHAVLFQSILKPSGAVYVPLARFDFRS